MNIEIFGEDERQKSAKSYLADKSSSFACVKILPIPSSKDGEHVFGTKILLKDFLSSLGEGDFVVGYALPKTFTKELSEKGTAFYDAALDEDFLVENAYITAVGTLGYILGTSKKIPKDMRLGIIGYGRIGSCLTRLFLFLGARVKIFSSKKLTKIELGFFGIDTPDIELSDFKNENLSGLDIVINTAPTNLSYLFPKKTIPEGMRVVDLASGNSFPGVLGVEYLPSLPGRMYPESAGKVYGERAALWLRDK